MAQPPRKEIKSPPRQPWRTPIPHVYSLNSVPTAPVQWLSPGRLAAGKITVLDGDPGLGKSTLLCDWAARISRGHPLPGGQPAAPRAVLILSAEDDPHDTIRPRIEAAAGDPRKIVGLNLMPDGSQHGLAFVIPDHVPLLDEFIERLDVALVIIDPLMAYLQRRLNAHSDQHARRALAALKSFGERTGAAIVVVRHLNKSAGANPLYRGGGSIGIIGAARCGLLLAPDPDDPARRILATTKSNLGLPAPSLAFRLDPVPALGATRVVWEGESSWSAASLLRAAEESDDSPSALAAARQWLRESLSAGPRPASELETEARHIGITLRTYRRARKLEGVVARKEQARHGRWLVALPPSPIPNQDQDQPQTRTQKPPDHPEDDHGPSLP